MLSWWTGPRSPVSWSCLRNLNVRFSRGRCGVEGGGRTHVLYAVLVRQLTTRPREDGKAEEEGGQGGGNQMVSLYSSWSTALF